MEVKTIHQYIECPLVPIIKNKNYPAVFLAGGITGCEEWQEKVRNSIIEDCVLLNPRRKDFPIKDPFAAEEQITWEFKMLEQTDLITFWFSDKTIQPIVLYELGRWLNSSKSIILSVHPNYPRKQDVYIQTKLARSNLTINNSLEKHIEAINGWLNAYWWRNMGCM